LPKPSKSCLCLCSNHCHWTATLQTSPTFALPSLLAFMKSVNSDSPVRDVPDIVKRHCGTMIVPSHCTRVMLKLVLPPHGQTDLTIKDNTRHAAGT
jgi:hypothetical protein